MVWQKDFPASSANLGPGFDSIGIAVDRYLRVTARPAERWRGSGPGNGGPLR